MIRKLKNNEHLFWKKTNMLLFSDLAYRMKDNARAFFMVAIISTVAFSAIGTLVGLNSYLTEGLRTANPISFVYNQHEKKDEKELVKIEEKLAQFNFAYKSVNGTMRYYDQNNENVLITTPEIYNRYAKFLGEKEISLQPNEVMVVEQSAANMLVPPNDLHQSSVILKDGTKVKVNAELSGSAKADILPEIMPYFIVGEEVYGQLPEPNYEFTTYGWQVTKGDMDQIIEAGKEITEEFPGVMAVDWVVYDINKMWSPIMFVGLFIGIVFFVSAGSFLYFRLYTDLDDDKMKFSAISKIGLTTKEMNRVMSKQIAILFFAPIVVAFIHGAVALTALSHMFGYNLVRESTLVLSSFFVIQIIYYIIVRYFYTKQVKTAM